MSPYYTPPYDDRSPDEHQKRLDQIDVKLDHLTELVTTIRLEQAAQAGAWKMAKVFGAIITAAISFLAVMK